MTKAVKRVTTKKVAAKASELRVEVDASNQKTQKSEHASGTRTRAIVDSAGGSTTELKKLKYDLEVAKALNAQLTEELEGARRAINGLREQTKSDLGTIADLRVKYDSVSRLYEAVISSRSWRMTGGLRLLMTFLIQTWRRFKLNRNYGASKGEFDEKAALLAGTPFFDEKYVAKQLGVAAGNRKEIAQLFYVAERTKEISPNPLFDPHYYRTKAGLGSKDDAVIHYVSLGAAQKKRPHRLFDPEWYMEQLPEAKDAPDLVVHYHEVGRKLRITPFSPKAVKIDPFIAELYFSDPVSVAANAYHPVIYLGMNPDLAALAPEDLHHHFIHHSKAENRVGTISAFLDDCSVLPNQIPLDFSPQEYAEINADLGQLWADQPVKLLRHYLADGMREGRPYNYDDLFGEFKPTDRTFSTDSVALIKDKVPLCVIVHMYYTDMWPELWSYLSNIKFEFDLYVNLVDSTWNFDIISEIRSSKPDANIYISPNRGRDIGGFWRLMDVTPFDKYVAFAILHAKKSPHVSPQIVEHWKRDLLSAILGSEEVASQNIAAFIEDEKIGIIGSAKWRNTDLGANETQYVNALDYYGVEEEYRDCEYVSGTMMMVRSDIMKAMYTPLKDYTFEDGEKKALSFHMDGQMAHAIERLYGNVMKKLGYQFLWR